MMCCSSYVSNRTPRSAFRNVSAIEQALSNHLGVFSRMLWADGKTETYAFTEVDRSLSFGGAAKGASWGRPLDTLGVAVAVNALSSPHRRFLEAGGLTFFLGDGRLSYDPEGIVGA